MSTLFVSTLNRSAGALLEALLRPLDSLSPIAGVAAVSVLVAVGALLVFKVTSNQKEIESAKRAMQAGLFEMRLFNRELRTLVHAQVDVLTATLTYLRLSAVPMLWMLLPLVLVTAHLQSHYGYQGLNPGDSALVKVRMKTESEAQARLLALEVPPGLRAETPMVWVPALREASWRIGAEREGGYVLDVMLRGVRFSKTVLVSSRAGPRSPVRPDAAILSQLRYPSEPPLPSDAPISSIAVTYQEGSLTMAGRKTTWVAVFLIVSLAAVLALRGPLRVTL